MSRPAIELHGKASMGSFHVVIAMTAGEKRAQIAYVSGAEELQKANDLLATLTYPQDFPDATPVRVVRKAVFSCSIYTKDCTVVLAPAWGRRGGKLSEGTV